MKRNDWETLPMTQFSMIGQRWISLSKLVQSCMKGGNGARGRGVFAIRSTQSGHIASSSLSLLLESSKEENKGRKRKIKTILMMTSHACRSQRLKRCDTQDGGIRRSRSSSTQRGDDERISIVRSHYCRPMQDGQRLN